MSEPTIADLYEAGLRRHLALAAELAPADGDVAVAACPGWAVRDVYAHLAGVCDDVLAGRLDGAATDEWTGRQVAARAGRTLADNVEELADKGPQLAKALAEFPVPQLPIDAWTHEQDVRGALGRPGSRDAEVVAWALPNVVKAVGRMREERGEPTVRIEGTSGSWLAGKGEPVATIRASDFELLRALLGRRSPAQVRAWVADGDAGAAVGTYAVFGPRPDPLEE